MENNSSWENFERVATKIKGQGIGGLYETPFHMLRNFDI